MKGKRPMAMQFFINPKNVDRLYPWGEDAEHKEYWVEVKRHLSARESQDVRAAGIPHVMQKPGDPNLTTEQQTKAAAEREVKMGLDMGRMALVRATKYIVKWSIPGPDGSTMPLSEATIGELLPEVFDAIDKALDTHKVKQEGALKTDPLVGEATRKSA
jgi:hypothetical protein